jgi:hypothetical protein
MTKPTGDGRPRIPTIMMLAILAVPITVAFIRYPMTAAALGGAISAMSAVYPLLSGSPARRSQQRQLDDGEQNDQNG